MGNFPTGFYKKKGGCTVGTALQKAISLILSSDAELLNILKVTAQMSLKSSLLALLLGVPLGICLGNSKFPGRGLLIILNRTLMGMPPVVCGLLFYILFSGVGPLRHMKLLFTVKIMILAQVALISNALSRISTQLSTALSAIDIKSFLSRLFAFTHTSKAYEIKEPVFSAKGSGGTAFTGVTAIDNRSNLTYIYPGEAFWTSSGMTAWTEDWLVGEPPEQTVKAVNGIKLNTPNIT